MKKPIVLFFIFFTAITFAQNNLLDTSLWTEGTGYITEFGRYGSSHENVRELDYGPFSQTEQVLIWKAIHDPITNNTTSNTNSGGWTTTKIDIQSNKTYRFTLWVKQLNSFTPSEFFGFTAYDSNDNFLSVPRVNSTPRTNPYFGCNLPTLNEWYLLEAYIHAEGSNISTPEGKIWDASGNQVGTLVDYIFPAGATKIAHKANTKNSSTSVGDQLFYYAPTMYDESNAPTIEELRDGIGLTVEGSSGPSVWAQSGNNIHYANGNVGVGNSNPTEKVHIEGNILLDAYNQGNEKGIFFREGFSSTKKYNLSILTNNNEGSSPDALSINAFDGVYFNTGSNNKNTRMLINSDGNVGIGTINPNAQLHLNKYQTTANYPSQTSRGDIFQLYTNANNSFEIGVGGASNTRRSWILSRHSDISGTYGRHYSTLHLQPDTGDKSQYRGIAIGYSANQHIDIGTHLAVNGNVGIGTTNPGEWKLAVNGKIRAKEIKVETGWADYVFLKGYKLPTLAEVAKHIKEKGHLINIPSAQEVEENGVELGKMNALLLEKIEELTLYILKQEQKLKEQEERLLKLEQLLLNTVKK